MKTKAIFNWSGGKDSALALYKIVEENRWNIVSLLTSINQSTNRVSMHGIGRELLRQQAENMNFPLAEMYLSENISMEDYDERMNTTLQPFVKKGVNTSIFGDIHLDDLKNYREEKLHKIGWKGYFPLWKKEGEILMKEFLDLGFKTVVCCVNEKYLSKDFVGITIDEYFIKNLPKNIDLCGENGEYHTFVYDGPLFRTPLDIEIGEIIRKTYTHHQEEIGFWFCDILRKK
jgi:uncharacterized protein (TIGR00290 family)